jgi:putative phosphoserine phosphatase/1-acylglycerol-3-phosphate O-acyltransferase
VLNIVDPPDVRIRVGKPIDLDHEDMDVDTKRLMQAITDLLPPEAHEWHEPTPEELAMTLPSSYRGDPEDYEREEVRRPGTD